MGVDIVMQRREVVGNSFGGNTNAGRRAVVQAFAAMAVMVAGLMDPGTSNAKTMTADGCVHEIAFVGQSDRKQDTPKPTGKTEVQGGDKKTGTKERSNTP